MKHDRISHAVLIVFTCQLPNLPLRLLLSNLGFNMLYWFLLGECFYITEQLRIPKTGERGLPGEFCFHRMQNAGFCWLVKIMLVG